MTDNTNQPTAENPSPIGHNNPPPSLYDAGALAIIFGDADNPGKYTDLDNSVTALLATIRETAPQTVETKHDNGIIAAHMSELRTTIKTVLHHHASEKAKYLEAERFIDQRFFGNRDRLIKARDILQARGDAYTARLVAEEKAERRRIADAAAKAADDARREAAQRAKEAADLEAAAQRARKPENIERLTTAAGKVSAAASMAQVDEMIANSKAENTMLSAAASSADIARTRHDTGHLSTGKQVPYVAITDKAQLDLKELLPFIKEDVLLAALKNWAKITDHKRPMAGAIIEMRDKAEYR